MPADAIAILKISIHAPREGGDRIMTADPVSLVISIHAPREGGDGFGDTEDRAYTIFQSTPPARGATACSTPMPIPGGYFNPRPPRGGRRRLSASCHRSPLFQSTPPARGATAILVDGGYYRKNFNPRPPRGGRRVRRLVDASDGVISIHAPREGGDPGRTVCGNQAVISIHAPREGGDPPDTQHPDGSQDFNPRPPRGGRPITLSIVFLILGFQSTPPARGATTARQIQQPKHSYFNPRPPRGGRPYPTMPVTLWGYFNPRPPRGGRLCWRRTTVSLSSFQSTPPARGATAENDTKNDRRKFQSTPPARGATLLETDHGIVAVISIHAPREGGDQ